MTSATAINSQQSFTFHPVTADYLTDMYFTLCEYICVHHIGQKQKSRETV